MPPRKKKDGCVRKNLDIDATAVKKIAKIAIDEGTNFKKKSETILKEYADKI
jgi:hypothetical protein